MGYNYYRNKQDNGAVMSAAEINAFNQQRKTATAEQAQAPSEGSKPAAA